MAKQSQMLSSIQVKDLKSFSDSGTVNLKRINIFIGANNAGKTTFLSAIELFFRSMRSGGLEGPLVFDSMPSFTSFDSTLRRHWTTTTQRPNKIVLTYEWKFDFQNKSNHRVYEFECNGQGSDDTIVVSTAKYTFGDDKPPIIANRVVDANTGRVDYSIQSGKRNIRTQEQWFHQMMPFEVIRLKQKALELSFAHRYAGFEVVNPYRPVPRSFYVLDDPNLANEDRSLLTYLIRLWASRDAEDKKTRARITGSLEKLGLTRHFDVTQVSKKIGPKVIEIRVAPTSSRQKVTIADAGFGLSQFLPLAVYDARLTGGTLIAYQPEVHLHPYAQSRLADVFVDSAARGNQLFIETHSTDLILRLQAKIASGEVQASDVAVLCFENKNGRSRVSTMSFDDSGKPSTTWPAGFLDTSLNLARELTSARITQLQKKNV